MKMQMPGNQSDDRDEALEAPARLVSALRQLPTQKIFVPPTIDESVLRAARTHLRPARKPGLTWLRYLPWATATAAAVVLVFLGLHYPNPGARNRSGDMNGDGIIDILDALALAKKVEAGATFRADIDLNGDGKVDHQDVAVLADKAVSLEKGGHS
jgi:hypothetical protein